MRIGRLRRSGDFEDSTVGQSTAGEAANTPFPLFLFLICATLAGVAAAYVARATDPMQRRRRRQRVALSVLSALMTLVAFEVPVVLGWMDYRVLFQTDRISPLYNPRYQIDRDLIGIHLPNERFRGSVAGRISTGSSEATLTARPRVLPLRWSGLLVSSAGCLRSRNVTLSSG